MKKRSLTKRWLALLVALAVAVTGMTIQKKTAAAEEANSSLEGYEAQIGETPYGSFAEALTAANAATEDVTIELLSDITVGGNIDIGNTNGKKVTVEGNNHKVTAQGGNNTFRITRSDSMAEFKNMTIDHRNYGAVIQVIDSITNAAVDLTDVTIDATAGSEYRYALINVLAAGTTTLNLTRVNAAMSVASAGLDSYAAIIRTGNVNQEKTVNINMTDCSLDTTGATGRNGIVVMKGTTANISLTNTVIGTKDKAPIMDYTGSARITKTNCTLSATDYIAQIDTALYADLAAALTAANAATADVTIELLADIAVTENNDIYNVNGNKVTIDGNNHTVTAQGGNNTFRITGPDTGTVEFKNMTIDHQNRGAAIQIRDAAKNTTLNLTNMVIEATEGAKYEWCLINTLAAGGTSTLNLTAVQVNMAVDSAGNDSDAAVIRTGNAGETKTVNINMTDCSLDTTGATGRSGIVVMKGTTANISLTDTQIKTMDTYAIRVLGEAKTLELTNCKLSSLAEEYIYNPIQNTDGCTWTAQKYDNVASYRTETELLAPENGPEGYVFAGWYLDEACTKENALKETDTATTEAYAKFVPAHVLDVKAQLSVNLINDDDTDDAVGSIRFVTTVDSLNYQEIGFVYTIQLSDGTKTSGTNSSNKVYTNLYAVGSKEGSILNYVPKYLFCAVSEYFKTLTIQGIPSSAFDAEITVQPFWVTLDGTRVYGGQVTKTVNEGIERIKGN